MLSLSNKTHLSKCDLAGLVQSPAALSVFFHLMIFSAAFGFFTKEEEVFEFTKFNIVAFQNAEESSEVRKVEVKEVPAQTKIAEKNVVKKSQETSNQTVFAKQYNNYANAIASELERRKSRFSLSLAPDNVKTSVVFKVKIDEKGNLVDFRFGKKSGHDFFDKIAEKILTCKKSFPVPPFEIAAGGVEFSIPILFDSV